MAQKPGDRSLSASGFSHQGGHFTFLRREGYSFQYFVAFIGKAHLMKTDTVICPFKLSCTAFERRSVKRLFQRLNFEVYLREYSDQCKCPHQHRSYGKAQAQCQHIAVKRHIPHNDHQCAERQGIQDHIGKQASVQGHPGPADFIPCECKVAVAVYGFFEVFSRFALPVKDAHDFHSVNVFDDRVVQALGSGKIAPHAVHSHGVHLSGSAQSEAQHDHSEQRHLPVHCNQDQQHHGGDRKIRDAFRDHVSQHQFDRFNIIIEQFFDSACPKILHISQGLLFQLLLQTDPQVFQCVICGAMAELQSDCISYCIEHAEDQNHYDSR